MYIDVRTFVLSRVHTEEDKLQYFTICFTLEEEEVEEEEEEEVHNSQLLCPAGSGLLPR